MNELQELEISPYPLSEKTKKGLKSIKTNDYRPTSDLFKALADPTRVRIIEALGVKELCVCVLVDMTGLQYSALSYHLKNLKDNDIISYRKDGNFLIYSLTPKGKAVHDFINKSQKL
ncbi:ArsR family transcriptional regulator [Methanocella paludicola SANAE]|uniref:ArsR family transcriptional regulator n=1 Tax=Methanocella paludicola (strain DSM 17711 / JCM 13418 / NBRC 101707 / SANAE) TaxID=304371 RepID=D1YWC4_METPS|nr:metalloregulator ArsR/SmtB family transcription factor [Methanocella paludicola]BAI60746.1 ArsR family transcriptional regulator [Methanocella paludicola SANAE]